MEDKVVKIQFRQDTLANWQASNAILDVGEPAIAFQRINDELKIVGFKVGDGQHIWSELNDYDDEGRIRQLENQINNEENGILKRLNDDESAIETLGTNFTTLDGHFSELSGEVQGFDDRIKKNADDILDLQGAVNVNSGLISQNTTAINNRYTKEETYTKTEVNTLIAQIPKLSLKIVQELPTTNISSETIYLVPSDNEEERNFYTEYVYVNKGTEQNPDWVWEELGTASIDLSGYVTSETFTSTLETYQEKLTAGQGINIITENNQNTIETVIPNAPTLIPGADKVYMLKCLVIGNKQTYVWEEQKEHFIFLVGNNEPYSLYEAVAGMTWSEFIDSDYNRENEFRLVEVEEAGETTEYVYNGTGYEVTLNGVQVKGTDEIIGIVNNQYPGTTYHVSLAQPQQEELL